MDKTGINQSIQEQIKVLHNILKKNNSLYEIVEEISKLKLPNYYIGGAAITQTVWNYLLDQPFSYGISDIDIVYYDTDLSLKKEIQTIKSVKTYFKNNYYKIDVTNQSRTHLWYKENFGIEINAYLSVEEAISSWETTATSIGVRLEGEELIVFAPYGMNDLFKKIVRPNELVVDRFIYENKVQEWKRMWRDLDYKQW